jgi:hypothetical protein
VIVHSQFFIGQVLPREEEKRVDNFFNIPIINRPLFKYSLISFLLAVLFLKFGAYAQTAIYRDLPAKPESVKPVIKPAPTGILVTNHGNPLALHSSRTYINPAGTRVESSVSFIDRASFGPTTVMLYGNANRPTEGTPALEQDSVLLTITAASGIHVLWQKYRRLPLGDLAILEPALANPVPCGKSEPCLPSRIILDCRLRSNPQATLWVYQIVLQ